MTYLIHYNTYSFQICSKKPRHKKVALPFIPSNNIPTIEHDHTYSSISISDDILNKSSEEIIYPVQKKIKVNIYLYFFIIYITENLKHIFFTA